MSIHIKIPWGDKYVIDNVVFDLNGTLANNGKIAETTVNLLKDLAEETNIYILTADTHGTAESLRKKMGDFIKIVVLQSDDHVEEKAKFVHSLGYRETIAIGNGMNDVKMVQEAVLSIGVIGKEGMYAPLIQRVSILVTDIDDAIEMLIHPLKMVATLRG